MDERRVVVDVADRDAGGSITSSRILATRGLASDLITVVPSPPTLVVG
jgi:hypothetical protein